MKLLMEKTKNMETKETIIRPQKGLLGVNYVELWEFRDLLLALVVRNLKARYKQSLLGVTWVIIRPLISMAIFTVLFGRIAKFPSDGIPYPIFVFLGLIPWAYFSSSVGGGTGSLVSNSGLISKIYFPRLILPISTNISNGVDFLISMVVLCIMMFFYNIVPQAKIVFIPLIVLGFFLTSIGPGLFFGALNVKYRDVGHAISFVVQIWMYITPVIYPLSFIPEQFRFYLYFNPMAGLIEAFRYCMLGTTELNVAGLSLSVAMSFLFLIVGVVFFRNTERTFADVI